jgi:anti-sigma regulatory factor (Ser/Thr protein kinase)
MTAISKLVGPGTVQTSVRLPPRSSAPRVARKLVRDLCTGSGLPDNLVDDAALVIGELVTTSVRQAHMAVQVVVVVAADEVTVRVYDKGTMPPAWWVTIFRPG